MDKNMIFVIKFEDIFEKKVFVIVVFSMLYFVCVKTHETWNSRFCFH